MSRDTAENNLYPEFPVNSIGEEQLLGPKITDILSKKTSTDPEAKLATNTNAGYTTVREEDGDAKDDIVIVNHTTNRTTTFEVDPETNLERTDNPVKNPEKWHGLLYKELKPGQAVLLKSENKAIAIRGIRNGKEAYFNLNSKYTNQQEFVNGEHVIKADVVDADTIWKTMDPEYAKGHILIDAKGTKETPVTYKAVRLEEAVVRADRSGRDYSEVPEADRVKMVQDRVSELINAKNITSEDDRAKALEALLPKNFTAKFERDTDSPYLLITIIHKDSQADTYGGKLVFKVDDLGSDIKPNPRVPDSDTLIKEIYVQSFDTKVSINKDSPTDLVKILPLIRPNAKTVETPPDTTQWRKEVERNELIKLRESLYKEYTALINKKDKDKTSDDIRKIRQIELQLGNLNNAVNVERGTLSPEKYDNKVKEQFEKNIVELGYTNADAKLFEAAGYDPNKLLLTVEEAIKKAKTKANEEEAKRIAAEETAKEALAEKDAKIKELQEEAARRQQEYIDGITAQQKVAEDAAKTLQEELARQAQKLEDLEKSLAEKEAQIKTLQESKATTGSISDDRYIEFIEGFGVPISVEDAKRYVKDVQATDSYDPKDPENIEDLELLERIYQRAQNPDGSYRTLMDQEIILAKYYLGRLDARRLKRKATV